MMRTKLMLAVAFLAGSFLAPATLESQPNRAQTVASYANNAWSCTQAADTIDVSATSPTQMSFINDGSNEVFIEVDGTAATTSDLRINTGEAYTINLREGYIRSISCICSTGETATVRVGGHR